MTEILIVGAGPVGLTMAAELARYGVGVRLIERAPHATETSKALVVWSRTLELMDRMGCTSAFLDAGLRATGASIRSGERILGRPRFAGVASAYNFALMIPQCETERLLTAHLRAFGVAIERQVELIDFTETADGVEASLRHADGRAEIVRTPWLIGCDGAHSTVRHTLDMPFAGSAQGDDWLLADVRLDGPAAPPPNEIATYLHRDGPFVVFPMPDSRARVIATLGKTDAIHPRSDPTLDDVQDLVEQRAGGGFRVCDPVWLTHFRINERKVAEYRRGHVFLVGDAAHIHSRRRRPGHEHRDAGCGKFGLEAGDGRSRSGGRTPARQLRPRAQRGWRPRPAQRHAADRSGDVVEPRGPGRAQPCASLSPRSSRRP